MSKLLLLIAVVGVCAITADDAGPVVCMEKGCVRGKSFKGNIKEFEGFLGIRYAKPPVGELRLKVSYKKLHNQAAFCFLFIEIYALRVKLKKVFLSLLHSRIQSRSTRSGAMCTTRPRRKCIACRRTI